LLLLLRAGDIRIWVPGDGRRLPVLRVQVGTVMRLGVAFNPVAEFVVGDHVGMDHFDLLGDLDRFLLPRIFLVKDNELSWLVALRGENGILLDKLKVDSTIQTLYFVLDEKGNLYVLILVELVDLLLDNPVVVVAEVAGEYHELRLHFGYQFIGVRPILNHCLHHFQVLDSDMEDFFRVACLNGLQLEAHEHEVEEFLHAAFIQPHDAGVGKPDEDLPGFDEGVHLIRLEDFFYEFVCEHCFDNILQDFLALFGRHILRPQPLIQDVDHLTS